LSFLALATHAPFTCAVNKMREMMWVKLTYGITAFINMVEHMTVSGDLAGNKGT